jgi:peptidoglycan/LPS O-acetylase OafA/YrhL
VPPTDRTDDRTADRRDYRLSGALTARLLGVAVAGLGALLIVLVVLVGALSLPRPVLTVGVLVIAAAVVVAGLVAVRRDLLRLVHDLERHRQRLNDLAYDTVALELGGSE